MPATVTHFLVGEKTLEKLGKNLDKKEREAFDLGCQGGDIFFFYGVLGGNKYPLLKKAGTVLHKERINAPVHYMNEFLSLINEEDKKIVKAYIMGYLCHFSTDTTAHPYIYALSDILEKEKNIESDSFYYHTRIESNLDVIMLLKLKDKTIIEIPPYSLFPKNSEVTEILSKMYSYAFEKAGYIKAPEEEYKKAFSCFRNGMHLLYSKGNLKRDFIYIHEFRNNADFAPLLVEDLAASGVFQNIKAY